MKKSIIALFVLGIIVAPMAFAAIPLPPKGIILPGANDTGITNTDSIGTQICVILSYMFYALIVLAIVFVLIAAFRYLTAAGDPEKVKSASKTLIYAAVAVAVGILAQAVPLIVASFIGSSQGTGGGLGVC